MELPQRTDTIAVTTKRLVFLGDPHGDLAGLDGVLAREPGAAIFSVGDNVGYSDGPTSSEFCRRLRDRGIASVSGNHEAWMKPDGTLAIVMKREAVWSLDADALAWSAQLPMRIRIEAATSLRIVVAHTILDVGRSQRWEYVTAANAAAVLDQEDADLVFAGHSHGPAIYSVGPGGVTKERLELDTDELVVGIESGVRYVVDAGSLGRPGHHPEPGRFDRATYAVLDLDTQTLRLRAFSKSAG